MALVAPQVLHSDSRDVIEEEGPVWRRAAADVPTSIVFRPVPPVPSVPSGEPAWCSRSPQTSCCAPTPPVCFPWPGAATIRTCTGSTRSGAGSCPWMAFTCPGRYARRSAGASSTCASTPPSWPSCGDARRPRRDGRTPGSTPRSRPCSPSFTRAAPPTASSVGGVTGWWADCTAWRWAGCSSAKACSRRCPMPPRWRCATWWRG